MTIKQLHNLQYECLLSLLQSFFDYIYSPLLFNKDICIDSFDFKSLFRANSDVVINH